MHPQTTEQSKHLPLPPFPQKASHTNPPLPPPVLDPRSRVPQLPRLPPNVPRVHNRHRHPRLLHHSRPVQHRKRPASRADRLRAAVRPRPSPGQLVRHDAGHDLRHDPELVRHVCLLGRRGPVERCGRESAESERLAGVRGAAAVCESRGVRLHDAGWVCG